MPKKWPTNANSFTMFSMEIKKLEFLVLSADNPFKMRPKQSDWPQNADSEGL